MNGWETEKKRVLVIDDERDVRQAIAMLLTEIMGFEVIQASDGPSALSIFKPGEFDLVTTDYVMPGMTGDEVAKRLKEIQPDLPILMITAFPGEMKIRENPADALIPKPFTMDQLQRGITELLNQPETLVTDER
jgi:CheY-like chemotaxis protein